MAKFSKSKCAGAFIEASKGIISATEQQAIFDEIDRRKNEGRIDQIAKQVTGKVLDQKEYESLQAKRTELGNIQGQRKIETKVNSLISKGLSPAKAFEAYPLGMSGHAGIGERNAAEPRRQTNEHAAVGSIMGALRKEKIQKYVTSGAFDTELFEARAKQGTTDPEALKNLKTPNLDKLKPEDQKAVMRAAELLNDSVEKQRQVGNARGTMTPKKEGYTGIQLHDRQKIRNAANPGKINLLDRTGVASKNVYQRDLVRLLDLPATRDKLVQMGRMGVLENLDQGKFLDSIWNINAQGVRKDVGNTGLHFSDNYAANAEKARILQFKGPAEQAEYNKKYGAGTVWQQHITQLRNMANTNTALDFFGPSVESNFAKVMKKKEIELENKANEYAKDPATADKADRLYKAVTDLKGSHATDYLNAFLGNDKGPGNLTVASIENGLTALSQMRKLGGAVLANIPTLVTTPLQANYAGVNLLKASFRTLAGTLKSLGNKDLDQWHRQTGVGNAFQLGQFASSIMDGVQRPGDMVGNMRSKFFAFSGMTGFKDLMGRRYVGMVSNEMAHNAGKEFAELPANMQRHMADYDISPKEWDLIRQHAVSDFSGYQVLASDKIGNIPIENFKGLGGASTNNAMLNARITLEEKLANLFRDSADYATVEPDLKTRQLIPFINGPRGTVPGALGRGTMQFSTWGYAHGVKVIQRQWNSKSFGEFMATTFGGLMLAGALEVVCRQGLQGKAPLENPELWQTDDPKKAAEAWGKFAFASAGASGLGGPMEDFLFSQTYANGRGAPLPMLGGPNVADAAQAYQWGYDGLLKGKVDSTQMLRFAQGNAPFVNVWYVKPLMNYLLWYGLEEHLDPGVLRRMEQNSAKAGDPYIQGMEPSQAAVRY